MEGPSSTNKWCEGITPKRQVNIKRVTRGETSQMEQDPNKFDFVRDLSTTNSHQTAVTLFCGNNLVLPSAPAVASMPVAW